MVERENGEEEEREKENEKEDEELKDVEKGEMGFEEHVTQNVPPREFQMSRMQRLSATNPLRLVINGGTRVPSASPSQQPHHHPSPSPSVPRSTPTPQVNLSLCVRVYI